MRLKSIIVALGLLITLFACAPALAQHHSAAWYRAHRRHHSAAWYRAHRHHHSAAWYRAHRHKK
jgi:hypothetical protein